MDDTLIVLKEYYSDADAHIAKGVLDAEGIPSIINNEIFSSVYPITTAPWGAIKLLVFRRDYEAACRALGLEGY